MAFVPLKPAAKAAAEVSMSCIKGRGGRMKVQLCVPTTVFVIAFGAHETFDMLIGTGPDAGRLLLRPNASGDFKPKQLKHTVLFDLPYGEAYTPDIEFKSCAVERREQEDRGMLIVLPLWTLKDNWSRIQRNRAETLGKKAA